MFIADEELLSSFRKLFEPENFYYFCNRWESVFFFWYMVQVGVVNKISAKIRRTTHGRNKEYKILVSKSYEKRPVGRKHVIE
jgi:hypothetical protein